MSTDAQVVKYQRDSGGIELVIEGNSLMIGVHWGGSAESYYPTPEEARDIAQHLLTWAAGVGE